MPGFKNNIFIDPMLPGYAIIFAFKTLQEINILLEARPGTEKVRANRGIMRFDTYCKRSIIKTTKIKYTNF